MGYHPDDFFFDAEIMPGAGTGALGVFLVVYVLFMLAVSAFSMVSYVLYSLGLYTIADRRGIRHSWLAWVPLGNLWILGSISDQYQYVTNGKVKNRRKWLVGLSIILFLLCFVWIIAMIVSLIMMRKMGGEVAASVMLIALGALLLIVLSIATVIYQYLCLYDLYHSCNPSNAVLFLVLSIAFSGVMPIFVFVCRKKDLGMPPRKRPAPQPVVEVPIEEPVVDPATEPVVAEGFARPEEFEEE